MMSKVEADQVSLSSIQPRLQERVMRLEEEQMAEFKEMTKKARILEEKKKENERKQAQKSQKKKF